MFTAAFVLQPDSETPLYLQLYEAIRTAITSGELAVGAKLPGKRTLAAAAGVSVNTVDAAYQMLAAEGYLEVRARSGFVVQDVPGLFPAQETAAPEAEAEAAVWRYDCSTGSVDTALFPFSTWGRIQRGLLFDHPELLKHGDRQGDRDLREAVAEYLRAYRGADCGAHQVVIGAGVEYLLGIAAQLLHGIAAVEEPGYARGRTILENNGIPCRPCGLDGAGLSIEALQASGANVCYVTPSHHFPTGVTMTAGRRAQLLRWAAADEKRCILEDDYDAEFRFDMRPLPSLQGMAGRAGQVIYLCTFSKSVAPGIRIACMVLPEPLLPLYRSRFGTYNCTVSRFEQQTLREFLTGGYFTRHLSRMRGVYQKRMQHLCARLEETFGEDALTLQGRHTGLHIMLTLQDGPGEAEMVQRCRRAGIRLEGLSAYYRDGCAPQDNTVILGYAALADADVDTLCGELKRLWTPAAQV